MFYTEEFKTPVATFKKDHLNRLDANLCIAKEHRFYGELFGFSEMLRTVGIVLTGKLFE